MRGQREQGFTLLEVLIALALFALLGVAINDLLKVGVVTVAAAGARSSVLQDGQMAQQIIAGRLSEAIYVYPKMSSSTAAAVLTSSGITTQNTAGPSGGQKWRVGTDPFMAMILPPRSPGATCTLSTVTDDDATEGNTAGCYRLFAYYAVRRDTLASSTLANSQKPPQDPNNADKWVLMEYRASLNDGTIAWTPTYDTLGNGSITNAPALNGTGTMFMGRAGRILTDYIKPASVVFNIQTAPPVLPDTQPIGTVQFSFNVAQTAGGTTQTANPDADPLGGLIDPRNWKCLSATTC